jgi:hypothetical protein
VITVDDLGAWLLKANGDTSDVAARAARGEHVKRWCVQRSYRTALMEAGQPVVLWVSGSRRVVPGLWAVGTLTGAATDDRVLPTGHIDTTDGARAARRQHVPVTLRWLDAADRVARDAVRADPRLADLEVLRQPMAANPSFATRAQWTALLDHLSAAAG